MFFLLFQVFKYLLLAWNQHSMPTSRTPVTLPPLTWKLYPLQRHQCKNRLSRLVNQLLRHQRQLQKLLHLLLLLDKMSMLVSISVYTISKKWSWYVDSVIMVWSWCNNVWSLCDYGLIVARLWCDHGATMVWWCVFTHSHTHLCYHSVHFIYYPFFPAQLAGIPQFAKLGPLFRSSPTPIELTESETEYVVNCVKHIFNDHIVFQVRRLKNTRSILELKIYI